MKSPVLEIKNLTKVYDGGIRALNDINLTLYEGEFLAIIGLSGSGKSTLLRCINRLIEPTSGSIKFRGVEMTSLPPSDLRLQRQKIGMIFQQFNLVKRHSVLKNVLSGALGRKSTIAGVAGLFSAEEREQARQYLEMVGLAEKAGKRADALSGGQQQRVAIARALMQDPDILLADEPVASLDPSTSHSVMKYLEKVNKELGKTVLCNLHFLSLVRQYTTRVIALKGGSIVFQGRPDEIDEAWFKQIYGEDAVSVEIH
jgi:phosphonate transport system ATP-binding protein